MVEALVGTRDPLDGEDGTTVVANPYHYTRNDPLNLSDPSGMRPTDDDTFVGSVVFVSMGITQQADGSTCSIPYQDTDTTFSIGTPSINWYGQKLDGCGVFQLGTSRSTWDDALKLPGRMRHMSEQGQKWQVQWEANVLGAYTDFNGHCTVARGVLIKQGACTQADFDANANMSVGESLLISEAKVFEIEAAFRSRMSNVRLTQWEWDALVDVAWNGPYHSEFTALLDAVKNRSGDLHAAFMKAGLGNSTLTARREADFKMFANGDYSTVKTDGVGTCRARGSDPNYATCPGWLMNQAH